jgi:NAD(P)-dependent dehydrogenase (short-subunit alcohol dehydrogenase family)
VTGGLGGVGLHVAGWLCERGARHLLLLGRRAPSAEAGAAIRALEQRGCTVRVVEADVANRPALARALDAVRESMPPLCGVVHAAGVLDDGLLSGQTWARFEAVLAPKVAGGWNLHVLTRDVPLRFFVCISSAAALFGSPGQGSYATANAFLDALAHHRRSMGLPALTVNFGPWANVGMAARLGEREQARLREAGALGLEPGEALAALDRALGRDLTQAAVFRLDPARAGARLLSELRVAPAREARPGAAGNAGPAEQLRQARPEDRERLLVDYLREQTSRVLGLAKGQLPDADASLTALGLESFMAFELRSRLQADLGIDVRSERLFDGTSLTALARLLLAEVKPDRAPAPTPE